MVRLYAWKQGIEWIGIAPSEPTYRVCRGQLEEQCSLNQRGTIDDPPELSTYRARSDDVTEWRVENNGLEDLRHRQRIVSERHFG